MKLYNTFYRESLFQIWKLWESPEDEFIQYFFIGKADFKVGNCKTALKMKLYNTSLSGKPIAKLETVGEHEDEIIQHFLIGFPANFGEDEGGDTVVQ